MSEANKLRIKICLLIRRRHASIKSGFLITQKGFKLDDNRAGSHLLSFDGQGSAMKPSQRRAIANALFFRPFAQFHVTYLITNRYTCQRTLKLLLAPPDICSTYPGGTLLLKLRTPECGVRLERAHHFI